MRRDASGLQRPYWRWRFQFRLALLGVCAGVIGLLLFGPAFSTPVAASTPAPTAAPSPTGGSSSITSTPSPRGSAGFVQPHSTAQPRRSGVQAAGVTSPNTGAAVDSLFGLGVTMLLLGLGMVAALRLLATRRSAASR